MTNKFQKFKELFLMFKTKEARKRFIITFISSLGCIIAFFIVRVAVRGDVSTPSGGELCILLIPIIIYFSSKNWKLFKETWYLKFKKDTTFDDYFDEYFSGKDMIEDTPRNTTHTQDFVS